jgi:hypothetical protein
MPVAMRIVIPGALLLAGLLSGCGAFSAGSAFYLIPYKFEELTCVELRARAKAAADRVKDQREAIEKASVSGGGRAIGSMVYGPEQKRAVWEQELYEQEAARKNCFDDMAPPK